MNLDCFYEMLKNRQQIWKIRKQRKIYIFNIKKKEIENFRVKCFGNLQATFNYLELNVQTLRKIDFADTHRQKLFLLI